MRARPARLSRNPCPPVERRSIGRAEIVRRGHRAVGRHVEPHCCVTEFLRRSSPGALWRRYAVARGKEDPARAVGHQPRAALPDTCLGVSKSRLGTPQHDRLARRVDARHVSRVGGEVAVGREPDVDRAIEQQQASPLPLGERRERLGRRVDGGALDRRPSTGQLRSARQAHTCTYADDRVRAVVHQRHEVHGPGSRVVDRSTGDPDARSEIGAALAPTRAPPGRGCPTSSRRRSPRSARRRCCSPSPQSRSGRPPPAARTPGRRPEWRRAARTCCRSPRKGQGPVRSGPSRPAGCPGRSSPRPRGPWRHALAGRSRW